MKTAILLIISSLFIASCAVNNVTGDSKAAFAQYKSSRVIDTQFPPLASDPQYVDVSKRQLFATLPYFKGDTYPERLAITGLGTASHGTLKKHYFPRLGTAENPDTFTFNNNGYGHKVVIVRNFATELADFNITVIDPATNEQLLSVNAIYGAISGVDAATTKRQWFIQSN